MVHASREPKIAVRGVRRVFGAGSAGEVDALGPIDLEVGDGEFCCIVGPSGCGKSTLLKVVAGLIPPTEGEVEIRHGDRGIKPLAVVFQHYGIYPWKTVLANVRLGMTVAGVPKAEADRRSRELLSRMGLAEFADAYPDTLSGGMRQRVAIARALAVEPEILLMDEPFAALDAQLRQVMQDELLAIWQANQRTVLFIAHSLEEAIVLGDRVVVMSHRPGRVLASVEVPFDRPRTGELRETPAFNELRANLWDLLKAEVSA